MTGDVDTVICDVCDCVSVCVHTLQGRRLELSTQNFVDIQCMTFAQHLSKGQGHVSYQMHCHCESACQLDCLGFLVELCVCLYIDCILK